MEAEASGRFFAQASRRERHFPQDLQLLASGQSRTAGQRPDAPRAWLSMIMGNL